jgi:hypothetical protein
MTRASRTTMRAPRRVNAAADPPIAAADPPSAANLGPSDAGVVVRGRSAMLAAGRSIVGGRSAHAPAAVAPASSSGRHARQAPASWFQQLEQHELEQVGQTLNSSAPAEPRRSRSSPHRSQNELVSYTRSPISSSSRPIEAPRPIGR